MGLLWAPRGQTVTDLGAKVARFRMAVAFHSALVALPPKLHRGSGLISLGWLLCAGWVLCALSLLPWRFCLAVLSTPPAFWPKVQSKLSELATGTVAPSRTIRQVLFHIARPCHLIRAACSLWFWSIHRFGGVSDWPDRGPVDPRSFGSCRSHLRWALAIPRRCRRADQ